MYDHSLCDQTKTSQTNITKAISLIELQFDEQLHLDTVSSIYFRSRELCSLDIEKQTLKLGGVCKIIVIDDSLYAKVKRSKGKDLSRPQVWCFGMVQRKD
ncbi:unnamed protein product [Brachionus calyciflorus]|uniref:Uncharacterized protein n=1 Tax=Brachionus calyciflorus TaxID=104777 RepID=A0A814BRC7_9BILA|nr:unnamed protein product [Brachionus calyciflorus]